MTNLWHWINSSASDQAAGEQVPTCSILLRIRCAGARLGLCLLPLWSCGCVTPAVLEQCTLCPALRPSEPPPVGGRQECRAAPGISALSQGLQFQSHGGCSAYQLSPSLSLCLSPSNLGRNTRIVWVWPFYKTEVPAFQLSLPSR